MPSSARPGRPVRALWENGLLILDANDRSIALAAEMLKAGRLVAIPTETVYGLAADASNLDAVSRVFAAKGRPASHPLIVHLPATAELAEWASHVPDAATRLAGAFWPGPLTMLLPRHASVLHAVTGGLDTVGLRVPAHPATQRLLQLFGGGLAAPSANRFGRVSPTTAAAVESELGEAVDVVIDGGQCKIGVESTIVAFIHGEVAIVRPGGISAEAITRILGDPPRIVADGSMRAPGTLASHYAPATPLVLCEPGEVARRAASLAATGARVGTLSLERTCAPGVAIAWGAGGDIATFARHLYSWLRQADAEALDALVVARPPEEGIGFAVADRLRRAAQR